MKKNLIFSTFGILLFLVLRINCGNVNNCLCWDEMTVEMKEKSSSLLKNISKISSNYEYLGFKSNESFAPCVCDDIIIVSSNVEMINNREFYFDLQSSREEIHDKEVELAEQVRNILEEEIKFSGIIAVKASFIKAGIFKTRSSHWKIEIVLKGLQFMYNPLVRQIMKYKLVTYPGGVSSISGIGSVVERSISFSVSPCEEKLPPKLPKNAIRNMLTKAIGKSSKAAYHCEYGYNNTLGKEIVVSTCHTGKWDPISKMIKCEKAKCKRSELPVLPNYGRHNATTEDEEKLVYKQKVIYSCDNRFEPNIKKKIESICNSEGQWSPIIEYECISEEYKKVFIAFNDDLQKWLKTPLYKRNPFSHFNFDSTDEGNWFYLVTIPSFIGLLLFLCCCLCATRTDSPLFLPCSEGDGPLKLRLVPS
ncbi:UNVERIFIED_CONTAM: hypothetical protein RMT77_006136 [Armadillidium vulgare]